MSPYLPSACAVFAADAHQQGSRPPSEGFMAQLAGQHVTRKVLAPSLTIRIGDAARQNGTIRADVRPGYLSSKSIKAAESRQVRGVER